MNIVHIVEAFGGGVYSFLKELTLNDSENKHCIIFSKRSETPSNYIDDFKNVKLIEIEMKREIDVVNDLKICLKIKKVLDELNPDILHLHSSKAGVYGRLINLFKIKKIPTIYNPHGLSFLQTNESEKKRLLFKVVERVFAKISPSVIVGVSRQEFEEISNQICAKSAFYICNGVSEIGTIKKENQIYDFVTIGRICEQKNPKLFNKFAELCPNKKFLWIGDGPDRQLLISNNIEITGWLEDKELLYKYLNSSKIYVQLSLWEGLPIALLEAMSLGLPCIVTDCIGLKEVIEEANNGQIIDYELKNLDTVISEMDKQYLIYSSNSKKVIATEYSISNTVRKYQKIYNEISG